MSKGKKKFGKIDSVSVGDKFNRWTILEKINSDYVKCKCDCGTIKNVKVYGLIDGGSKSCGCLQREKAKLNNSGFKHGDTHTKLFNVWVKMRQRCTKKYDKEFKYYGGKGIKVCDEWEDYISFKNWALNNGYKENLTIDRIDFDGDYCIENCRWTDMITQNNNRSNNVLIEIDKIIKTLAQWCKIYNFDYKSAWCRYNRGKRGKDIFNPNFVHPTLVTHNGETYSMKHWAKILGIDAATFRYRVIHNWSENRMFKELNKEE